MPDSPGRAPLRAVLTKYGLIGGVKIRVEIITLSPRAIATRRVFEPSGLICGGGSGVCVVASRLCCGDWFWSVPLM
jgi:hypothetical protein